MSFLHRFLSSIRSSAGSTVSPRAQLHGLVFDPSSDVHVEEFVRSGLGGQSTVAGVSINADIASRVAAVYRCVGLLSEPLGSLPLELIRRVGDMRERADDLALWSVLAERPNRWQTPFEFFTLMQRRVLLRGNAYARIIRNQRREVTDLVPLDPDHVRVEQLPDWSIVYRYAPRRGIEIQLRETDVLHVRNRTRDGVVGLSVIEHARESIGLAVQTERHGATLFRRGARPSGVFKHPTELSQAAYERLQDQLAEHAGAENSSGTLILESGADFSPVSMTAEDAQFIQTRAFTRAEIATFFGVPPHMLGDTERATSWGSGIEQQTIGFITYSLRPWLVMWEQAIKRALLPNERGVTAKFDVAELLAGDIKAEAQRDALALQWGWLNPDEVRARRGLNPRPGGDAYYPPPNMTATPASAGDAGEEE